MFDAARTVFRKELIDNLRDRRSLSSALLVPMLGPVIMAVMFTVLGKVISERAEKALELPIVGAEHAPSLVHFLRQQHTDIKPPPADPHASIRDGTHDVVLQIPADFGERFANGEPAPVVLIVDHSRQEAGVSIDRANRLLQAYAAQIGQLRLMLRGVDPAATAVLAINETDLSTAQSRSAQILSMMPYFILFAVFLGGLYIAIDITAGERERNTLEQLLVQPIGSGELVLGKLLAVLVFTFVALAESLLAFGIVLTVAPLDRLGLIVTIHPATMLGVLLIAMPICLIAAALQMLIATFCRSFKEAQTWLGLLPLIPALPGIAIIMLPVKTKLWMMLIPTFGEQVLMNRLIRGEAIDPLFITASVMTTLTVGALLVWLLIRLYRRESVIFVR